MLLGRLEDSTKTSSFLGPCFYVRNNLYCLLLIPQLWLHSFDTEHVSHHGTWLGVEHLVSSEFRQQKWREQRHRIMPLLIEPSFLSWWCPEIFICLLYSLEFVSHVNAFPSFTYITACCEPDRRSVPVACQRSFPPKCLMTDLQTIYNLAMCRTSYSSER